MFFRNNLLSAWLNSVRQGTRVRDPPLVEKSLSFTAKFRWSTARSGVAQSIDLVCLNPMSGGLSDAEAKFCRQITEKFQKCHLSWPFHEPVDPQRDGIPDYFTYVKDPMDLGTISQKLDSGSYTSAAQWKADLMQVWKNAKLYNPKGTIMNLLADKLQKKATKWTSSLPQTDLDLWHMKLLQATHDISVLLNDIQPSKAAKIQPTKIRASI
jgi:hypothetical protein